MVNNKKIRVLVAEDDFLVSEEIMRALKSIGFEQVGDASDGLEAVKMTCKIRPDVVLMDIKMPELDGLEACRQIQERCPTPVVALTAYESKDLIEKASKMGVASYLTKPPKPAEIERAITIAIARHKDLMELRWLNTELKKEIASRKNAEAKLKELLQEKEDLLKEKEVLLQEIHHRVKNNFAIISSLLRLQSRSIKDKQAHEIFQESHNRIHSMAIIHKQLYQSKDLTKINFRGYIRNLAESLFKSYVTDIDKISLEMNIQDVSLGIDQAIPCGLLLNELISNALKHAFPPTWVGKGKVEISFRKSGKNNMELIVNDNGVGLPNGINIRETESFGMHLVTLLAEGQLKGKINLGRKKGTKFQIIFRYRDS